MTTLDVGISGPQGAIDLSNGLLGAATTVFSEAGRAVREGRASGIVGAAGCDVTMKGAVLRDILSTDDRSGLSEKHSSPQDEVARFIEGIDPDADYKVTALEL